MNLITFFLKRPLLTNLIAVLALTLAVIRSMDMQLESFPPVDFDVVSIVTPYPGSSPKEVEQFVTNLIEDEIKNIEGIDELTSTSIEGMSYVSVKLDPDLSDKSKNSTIDEIQRAIDRIRDLPDEVTESPIVKEINSADMPVIELAISGDVPYEVLHKTAEELSDLITSIPDSKDVIMNGFREKEFWVEVDPNKLKKNYISLSNITATLATQNLNLPGGVLKAPEGDYLVRTIGEVTTPKEVDQLILRTNTAGVKVRVKDVGKTKSTFEEESKIFRTNSFTSINLLILKKSSGDIIELVEQSKEVVNQYFANNEYKNKITVSYVNDMSVFVKRRLGVLLNNGVAGVALVLICLLLFLSPGIALVAAAGMPVAFLGTILVMSYTGLSINLITMFGLVIVLGMLVDDAIIVAENIWQHYEKGEKPWDAVVNGTTEVILPVFATILTSISAFSPLLMVSGVFGKFIAAMPKVVMIALVISLIEAMFLLPSHAHDALKWAENRKKRRKKSHSQNPDKPHSGPIARMVANITDIYGKSLHFTLRVRWLFFAAILSLFAGTVYFAATKMQLMIFPPEGVEAFFVKGELPHGMTLEDTSEKIRAYENVIREVIKDTELKDYVTKVGVHEHDATDPLKARGSNLAQIGVFLVPEPERNRKASDIIDALRKPIAEVSKKHGFVKFSFEELRRGPPVGKPVAIKLFGDDLAILEKSADKVQEILTTIPGVKDIGENFLPGKTELQVVVNSDAASEYLLSTRDIALHVRAMLEGQVATYIRTNDERIAVRVRFEENTRKLVNGVKNSYLTNARGIRIPLAKVVTFKTKPGISAISHEETRRTITVAAAIDERSTSSTEVNKKLGSILDSEFKNFPNIQYKLGGEYEDTNESMTSLATAFIFAMALIFLILATQFSSLTQPFVVMAAIPFGIIGVIIAFYLHGLPLSFLGMVGVIGLSGVVVNDSIVLVDFVNKARKNSMSSFDACIYAGKRRFRAVWLTTITTVFGLLPLVYGLGGHDAFLKPAAVALGYGLIFATVLVLFFVPSLYLVRIDILNFLRTIFSPVCKLLGVNLKKEI